MAWQGTVHPFRFKPAWSEIIDLSWEQQLAKLKDPAFKARMIAEENVWPESDIIDFLKIVALGWPVQFEMDPDFNYEPKMDERTEENTSELQSLMRISYAVLSLQK